MLCLGYFISEIKKASSVLSKVDIMKKDKMNLRMRLKRSGVTLKDLSHETSIAESTICHILNDTLQSKVKYSAEKLIAERIMEVRSATS